MWKARPDHRGKMVRTAPGHGIRVTARALRILVVLAAASLMATSLAGTALATDPFRLSADVTDQAGVLSTSGKSEAQAAIDGLQASSGLALWAVYVDTTGDLGIDAWGRQMLSLNGFGPQDALLAIAVSDRAYRLFVDSAMLSDAQVQAIATTYIRPSLSAGDWSGATVGAAAGLQKTLASGSVATPAPSSGGSSGPTGGSQDTTSGAGFPWFALVLVVIGAAIVLIVGLRAAMSVRLRARTQEEKDAQTGDLARRANVALLQTDDLVRDAEQEVGFAEAQFGDDAAPYRAALEAARGDMKVAFKARQQLDDEIPDDAATRTQLLGQIVASCDSARARLAEQAAAFEQLRAVEREAPAVLAGLGPALEGLKARLPASRAAREALAAYAESDWSSIAGNIPEAEKRIAFAEKAVGTDPGAAGAGRTARLARKAVTDATDLLDALDRLVVSLASAKESAVAEIAAAEADIANARGALSGGGPDGGAPAGVAAIEAKVAAARASLALPRPDVLGALKTAQEANLLGDQVLAGIRDARAEATRAAAALESAIGAAQVSVGRASDYIATRRNGVRQEARTRLAEAQRHLDEALRLRATEGATATTEARTAQQMADEAYRLARSDFDTWDSGGFGGGGRRGSEGELVGALLGGFLGGLLGSGRGGFGGTPWGIPGGPRGMPGGGGWSGGGGSWGGVLGKGGGGGGWSSGGGRF